MRKTIVVFLMIMICFPLSLYGSKVDTKKKELDHVKGSIKESKQQLEMTKKEKEKIENELKSLDQTIVAVEQQLNDINGQLDMKEEELEQSEQDLQTAIEERQDQYDRGKERIESMYKNQKIGYIQVIFTSKSFGEMLNRMEYIRKIAEYDQTTLERIQEKQAEVEVRTEKLEREKQAIALLQKEQTGVKGQLEATRQQKDVILAQLARDEEKLQAQIKDMIQISSDLEKEIKKLTQESKLKYTGGKFLWPVPGFYRISSDYNPRNSPISGRYEFHTGIDIPASFGQPVVAAAGGQVITAGWVNGFGNTVMIDHGSGYVTLYGHNSSVTVSRGQTVERGSQIARIGSTGYSTGNHCHFEVRLNGAHKNPHNYLK